MTTMVAHSSLAVRPCTMPPVDLAGVGRTFEHATQAVWVHDLSGRCVYRNQAARATTPCAARDTLHDILDHRDGPVGLLRLRMP